MKIDLMPTPNDTEGPAIIDVEIVGEKKLPVKRDEGSGGGGSGSNILLVFGGVGTILAIFVSPVVAAVFAAVVTMVLAIKAMNIGEVTDADVYGGHENVVSNPVKAGGGNKSCCDMYVGGDVNINIGNTTINTTNNSIPVWVVVSLVIIVVASFSWGWLFLSTPTLPQ